MLTTYSSDYSAQPSCVTYKGGVGRFENNRPYKYMNVCFVPSAILDMRRLCGASIHDLFNDSANKFSSVQDRAFLLAFDLLVRKMLNLYGPAEPASVAGEPLSFTLSRSEALLKTIKKQYFDSEVDCFKNTDGSNLLFDHEMVQHNQECSTNYVIVYPGAFVTEYQEYDRPSVFEIVKIAVDQQLRALRESLKPFSMFHSKEEIASANPSGVFTAYLEILSIV